MLRSVFGSRYSRVVRVGIPIALVALVAVPLAGALRQVAWEVQARSAISRGLALVPSEDVVQSAVSIRGRTVNVRLYMIGSPVDATAIERDLTDRLRHAAADAEPVIRVVAVPEASAPEPARPVADPVATLPELVSLRKRIEAALVESWPATGGGSLIRWEMRYSSTDSISVVPTHIGEPIPAAASALLGKIILDRTGMPVAIRPHAIADSVYASTARPEVWQGYIRDARPLLLANRSLQLCVAAPAPEDSATVSGLLASLLAGAAPGQVHRLPPTGSGFTARLGVYAEGASPCGATP